MCSPCPSDSSSSSPSATTCTCNIGYARPTRMTESTTEACLGECIVVRVRGLASVSGCGDGWHEDGGCS